MEHITQPALRVLENITSRRIGIIMAFLDLSNSPDLLKESIKKQFWEMKEEITDKVLNGGKNGR